MKLFYNSTKQFICSLFFISFFSSNVFAQSATAVPGACSGTNNQYTVTGAVTWGAMPATGQMIISVAGEGTTIKNAPFTSPVSYSIAGLNSDGAAKTVNVRFTESATTVNQNYTAPAACIVNDCAPDLSRSLTYSYDIPLQFTDLEDVVTSLPKFNTYGGARILQKVLITVQNTMLSSSISENTSMVSTNAKIKSTVTSYVNLGNFNTGTTLISSDLATNPAQITFAAGVSIPPSTSYTGDVNGSTLEGLLTYSPNWRVAMDNMSDPRTGANWITTLTGNAGDDADMKFIPAYEICQSNSVLETSSLNNYTGTGNLPITLSTSGGFSIIGAGGGLEVEIITKFAATLKVTYFYCVSVANSTLPLSLLGFSGTTANGYNNLKWSAAQAADVDKFILERSADGVNFNKAGEVPVINTAVQQDYNYKDYLSGNNKWFYRLKIVDNDGTYKYSSTILLSQEKDGASLLVYPNPASDRIYINSAKKINKLEIINMTGTVLKVKTNINLTEPIITSSFAPGVYFIKAYTADEVFISKFIKN